MRMGSRCPLCPHVTGWKTTALPAASDFSKLLSSSAVALLLAVLEQDEQRAKRDSNIAKQRHGTGSTRGKLILLFSYSVFLLLILVL